MNRPLVTLVAASAYALLAGCAAAPTAAENFVRPDSGGIRRAAFELDCPETELHVQDLGSWTIGVSGCGKRAVYKYAMGAGWVNNSGGESRPEPEATDAK